ncbi:hypothetical protein BKA61DRAFT_717923 [Leptodontidium sp. MPI-SDFR-AT-0119]|nr:hypothetical protein BKA61DRAFT_717923 [Leptodontidium sp. MPI-SDFR-AT-0119]
MLLLIVAVLLCSLVTSTLGADSNSVFQNFGSPAAKYRPKFRYWLPDASISPDVLSQDIASMAEVGAGGLEFLPFYLYGNVVGGGLPPADWNTYGFGTLAFRDIFQRALESSKANGLLFDFAVGASQGQGVPSVPGTAGLAMELIYGHATISGGEEFKGAIPPPTNLDESTIVDLTSHVKNGTLNWKAPSTASNYTLITFYQRYTNQRSCIGGVNATNFIANGSWTVDHFSASGAKRTTDFLDEYLLYGEVKELLTEVGEYSWEDSMEFQAALFWTPDFLTRFQASRGYSAVKYLPLFFNISNQWNQEQPAYNETWAYGQYDENGKSVHLGDYQTTLNEGYQDYLQHFNRWANSLGLKHSCQPAYNLPLDMLADVPVVDVPELESLGFRDDKDLYRQFTGPAHLQHNNVISTEVGAVKSGAYVMTVPSLLRSFKDSFAGGVNMMVIHGFAYTGEYPGTTWPGYTSFFYLFTEQWNQKHPAWKHFKDSMDYTARCQMMLQSGVPQIDLIFYLFEEPWTATNANMSENLKEAGYSYEYLTAANLLSSQALVKSGVLAPDGPAYKALIIPSKADISIDVAKKLHKFAAAGLPIVFVGIIPKGGIGTDETRSSISESLQSLLAKYPNSHRIDDQSQLLGFLSTKAITPRVSITSPTSDIYTVRRSVSREGLDFVFFLNQGSSTTVDFNVQGVQHSKPYILDAWTGMIEPLVMYNITDTGISLSMTLNPYQTKIIAFVKSAKVAPVHVVSFSGDIFGFTTNNNTGVEALATGPGTVTLSDGRNVNVNASPMAEVNVTQWYLSIQSYHPSSNSSSTANEITNINVGVLDKLVPWTSLPGHEQISGIGMYNSSFDFPHSPSKVAATVSFGPILNTLRAWVNNQLLPPIDVTDPRADLTRYLKQGLNSISIEVSSTLFNAVKAHAKNISSAYAPLSLTNGIYYEENDYAPFGLLGPVVVTSMARAKLPI